MKNLLFYLLVGMLPITSFFGCGKSSDIQIKEEMFKYEENSLMTLVEIGSPDTSLTVHTKWINGKDLVDFDVLYPASLILLTKSVDSSYFIDSSMLKKNFFLFFEEKYVTVGNFKNKFKRQCVVQIIPVEFSIDYAERLYYKYR